jgi:hypothetical protein
MELNSQVKGQRRVENATLPFSVLFCVQKRERVSCLATVFLEKKGCSEKEILVFLAIKPSKHFFIQLKEVWTNFKEE